MFERMDLIHMGNMNSEVTSYPSFNVVCKNMALQIKSLTNS